MNWITVMFVLLLLGALVGVVLYLLKHGRIVMPAESSAPPPPPPPRSAKEAVDRAKEAAEQDLADKRRAVDELETAANDAMANVADLWRRVREKRGFAKAKRAQAEKTEIDQQKRQLETLASRLDADADQIEQIDIPTAEKLADQAVQSFETAVRTWKEIDVTIRKEVGNADRLQAEATVAKMRASLHSKDGAVSKLRDAVGKVEAEVIEAEAQVREGQAGQ